MKKNLMKLVALTCTLGWSVLVGGCQNDIIACDSQGCVSEQDFASGIVSALKAKPGVVGYVVYVGGLPAFFGGNAVLSPNTAMLPNDITNIASVSKMLTTFAVLQSLSNHNISLDATITPYMYSDWQAVASRSVQQITFRQLLTHRSGFPVNGSGGPLDCGGNNTSYATLELLIQSAVTPPAAGMPGVYSNCNFAIFRELLPQMEQDTVVNLTPDDVIGLNPRAQLSADFYINYVNQYVLGPSDVDGLRNCSPTTNSNLQVVSYPVPPATTPNTNWGDWTYTCGGGGWNMSGFDMFQVFDAVGTANLLTAAEQQELFVGGSNYPGLGWDNTVGNCPGATADGRTYYWCKNGGLGGATGQAGIETFAGLFKCNAVPVIVIVNSPISQNITSVVTTAFNSPAAQATGYAATCQIHDVGL